MEKEMKEELDLKVLRLNGVELKLLSNLYFNKEYPYCFISSAEAYKIANRTKRRTRAILDGLVEKGLLTKQRAYISFYYPIRDDKIRHFLLKELGLLK